MALVHPYCTVAELRDHLRDTDSNMTQSLLERAINATSRAIDEHCDRRFWQDAAVTERAYVVTDSRWVRVDDISTRTDLVVKTGTDGITFPTTLASSQFILEPRNADAYASGDETGVAFAFSKIVSTTGYFPMFRDLPTVQVTARFGWSAIPYQVNEACILKAAALFKRKDAPFGVAGFGEFGAVRITRADPDVIDLLSPFVKPMVARP